MIKDAIEKILSLAEVEILQIGDRPYANRNVFPVKDPSPDPLSVNTLTSLSEYLETNVDGLLKDDLLLHVKNHLSVDLVSCLGETWLDRRNFMAASAAPAPFPFGQWIDVEGFIIRMQALFVQDEQTAAILRIVGNVTDSTVKQFNDDGVTQQVTAKVGVARVTDIPVPNPVTLRPYRTFLEIEQPASRFIFRMRSGNEAPACALFEADGGSWKNEAMASIKKWLDANVAGVTVIA